MLVVAIDQDHVEMLAGQPFHGNRWLFEEVERDGKLIENLTNSFEGFLVIAQKECMRGHAIC